MPRTKIKSNESEPVETRFRTSAISYVGVSYEQAEDIAKNGLIDHVNIEPAKYEDSEDVAMMIAANSPFALRIGYEDALFTATYNASSSDKLCILRFNHHNQIARNKPLNTNEKYKLCGFNALTESIRKGRTSLEIGIIENAYNPYLLPIYHAYALRQYGDTPETLPDDVKNNKTLFSAIESFHEHYDEKEYERIIFSNVPKSFDELPQMQITFV